MPTHSFQDGPRRRRCGCHPNQRPAKLDMSQNSAGDLVVGDEGEFRGRDGGESIEDGVQLAHSNALAIKKGCECALQWNQGGQEAPRGFTRRLSYSFLSVVFPLAARRDQNEGSASHSLNAASSAARSRVCHSSTRAAALASRSALYASHSASVWKSLFRFWPPGTCSILAQD